MKIGILIAFLVLTRLIVAQEISSCVIAFSGAEFENGNIIINQTIGETVIESLSVDGLIITQGFQQVSYGITRINNDVNTQILVSVYPNPTSRFVNVIYENEAYSCVLFNTNGSILMKKEAINGMVSIDLSNFSDAMYMLKLVDCRGELLDQYRIIKN